MQIARHKNQIYRSVAFHILLLSFFRFFPLSLFLHRSIQQYICFKNNNNANGTNAIIKNALRFEYVKEKGKISAINSIYDALCLKCNNTNGFFFLKL